MTSPPPVSVKVTYRIQRDNDEDIVEERVFDTSNVQPARIGLPEGTQPVKPDAGSFCYSGMHDQGPLPITHEGGQMAHLIACVQQAKQTNNDLLTQIIRDEKNLHVFKKAKTNETT